MVLNVSAALRHGGSIISTSIGLRFVGILFVLNLLFVGAPTAVLAVETSSRDAVVLGLLSFIGFVLSTVIIVVMIRAMMEDAEGVSLTELGSDGTVMATVNMVLGAIVAAVVIGLGLLLIVPGLYLLVSLLFWPVFVVVEQKDFIDAYRESWRLVRGRRWRVLWLVIGMFVAVLLLNLVAGVVAVVLPGPFMNAVVSTLSSAIGTVFVVAVIVEAYQQLGQSGGEESEAFM